MSLKKRIFLSNVFMGILSIMFVGSILGAIYMSFGNMENFNFLNVEYMNIALDETTEYISEILKEDGYTTDDLEGALQRHHYSKFEIYIKENGQEIYNLSPLSLNDEKLLETLDNSEVLTSVSSGERSLYKRSADVNEKNYNIYFFYSQSESMHQMPNSMLFFRVIFIIIGGGFIFLTNRFLMKFIFKKINEPLSILTDGVTELQSGNLDVRLDYRGNDEFAKVITSFNEMLSKLQEAKELELRYEENRKEFLIGVTHDLRTPLTAIQAYVEGLLDGVATTPTMQKKYLETIKTKSETIQKMISQIILFSKTDMEKFSLDMNDVRIDEVIEKFLTDWSEEYKLSGLDITVSTSPITAFVDIEHLKTVLTNIADNSLKYKLKKQGHLHITINEKADSVELSLCDDGPGVSENALLKLFDMFYRDDEARQQTDKGSGIGLAIVKKLVSNMEGDIRAENLKNGGLGIYITLVKRGI